MKDRPRITITVQPDHDDDRRTDRDLRRLLKALLRGYHFKCVSIKQTKEEQDR